MRALVFLFALTIPLGLAHSRRPPLRYHPSAAAGQRTTLPADAKLIVDKLTKQRQAIYREAEAKLAPLQREAARRLRLLQDRYTRAAKLDEALAIRAKIREVLGVRKDPGALRAQPSDMGKAFLYEVTGSLTGSIWGSQIYTTDSHLGTAAVHAGVLKPGQRGIVRVWILPGQSHYGASTSNAVTSYGYGPWSLSFSVERQ